MIVKNEAGNIRGVLEAARPYVDRWTVLDTGSTDGTQAIVQEVMKDVPGALFEENFIDFASSRNNVMKLDAEALKPPRSVFQLMLSGDEYLAGGAALRAHLERYRDSLIDCHMINVVVDGASRSLMPRVLRTGSEWKYHGKVHETPKHPDPKAQVEVVRGADIIHTVSDPERRFRNIAEHHIPLLESMLDEDPYDERALIFLAQSYNSILSHAHPAEAVTIAMQSMSLYKRRLDIRSGTAIERNYCVMQYLDNARIAGIYTPQELYDRCVRQANEDPHRPEMALLRAIVAVSVETPKKVYQLTRHAVQVAIEVEKIDNVSTVDLGSLERAHELAASVAELIADQAPQERWQGMLYADLAREHRREIEKKKKKKKKKKNGDQS